MVKQKLFAGLLVTFIILIGAGVTVRAMRINPPTNLDHVVMGNISGTRVEMAVASGDETLVTDFPAEVPETFFAFTGEDDDETLIDVGGLNGLSIVQPFTSDDAEGATE